MARRKRSKHYYKYDCTITGETFTRTAEAPNPEELLSVPAWYEMNPEKDDRPEHVKVTQKLKEQDEEQELDPFEQLAKDLGVEPKSRS